MDEYLLNQEHKRGKVFWMSYKELFNENKPNVGIIVNSHREILYTMSAISKNSRKTFFEGTHLHKQTFDESMEKTVNLFLQQPEEIGEHDFEIIQDFFSSEELKDSLTLCPSTNSFDADGIHIQMMKKLGNYAKTFLLEISNKCWFGHGPNHE